MQIVRCSSGVRMSYDEALHTIEITLDSVPPEKKFFLENAAEVRTFFSDLMLQWSQLTTNRRIFWLINDAGFTVAPAARQTYAEQINFIAQVTAEDIFVFGTESAPGAATHRAKRYPTRAQAAAARDMRLKGPKKADISQFHIDITKRCRNGLTLAFDTKHQIVEIKVPPRPEGRRYFLETVADIEEHIQDVHTAWLAGARGQRVFFIIDYDNFDVSPAHMHRYVQLANEFFSHSSLGVVRYNANLLQSTAIRYTSMKSATPVNLFKERADALAIVETLKEGRVQFSNTASPVRRTAKCMNGITLTYDRSNQVMEVNAPAAAAGKQYLIETQTDVRRYLQEVTLAWGEMAGSKPVYWLVNPTDHLSRPCILHAETTACSGAA